MKYFITLENVPCWRDNELVRGQHILHKDLDYTTTNSQILSNGDFYFELWDDEGYIGKYVIGKKHLHLIKELTLEEFNLLPKIFGW